jgi:uncharacterized protein YjdB
VLVFSSSGKSSITVGTSSSVSLTSITVTPSSLSLTVGAVQQYTATCLYSDGSSANCTSTVNWTSSATGVITVNSLGLAAAAAAGSANLIATRSSIGGEATVTVNLTQVATPTFSPAGGTYTSARAVSIRTTTPSAIIHYTTNGSTPTTGSATYSVPIKVSVSETVRAIAVASGHSASAAASAAYTINLPRAATPTFSP